MNLEVGMAGEPSLDGRGLVRAVVVHDQMHRMVCGNVLIDMLQELQELLGAMSAMQLADHFAGGDIERRKQRRGAVPHVVMRPALRHPGHERQNRLGAVQRLNT